MYFNTSHVNVNRCIIVLSGIRTAISIHLMLMLITFLIKQRQSRRYISIHLMLMLIASLLRSILILIYFNTSHVNVNRNTCEKPVIDSYYFNTSHVNVNLYDMQGQHIIFSISIHLMLMLIRITLVIYFPCLRNFNTSHVNVNLNSC